MEQQTNTSFTISVHRLQIFSATALKLLAAALMLLDHVHQMFAAVGAPMWLTMLGRPVFPLFLFAAAESFHYTRDRRKYLKRLLFASWGMTILTFVVQRVFPNPNVVLMNNAFSTFFIAALYMFFWDMLAAGICERKPLPVIKAVLCCFIPILLAAPIFFVANLTVHNELPLGAVRALATLALLVPNMLTVEGGAAMVALGVFFYIFRKRRWLQILSLLLLSALVYRTGGGIQWMMCFAAIPMALYNGQRGYGMKNFFYVFYPAHIVLLYLLSSFIQ
jgi:hypothetical protein